MGFVITVLVFGILVVAGVIGWVLNIVKLITAGVAYRASENGMMIVLRVFGVFVPVVGAVMGYIK